MKEYNLFTESEKLKEDALFIIDEIQYWKKHKLSDEEIAKKAKISYLDWIENSKEFPINPLGHFTLGHFGSYDIEINFIILDNNQIGFEVCLTSSLKPEIESVFVYKKNILKKGTNFNKF